MWLLPVAGPIAGAVVLAINLVLLFRWLSGRSLTVGLAMRYLLRLRARGATIHLLTLGIVVIAGAAQGGYWWATRGAVHPFADPKWWVQGLHWVALGAAIAAVLIGFFLLLLRHFTVFPAISTFGLFLGSAALVVVLSVMSGFEQDLKQKILGANAHVIVTAPDRPFTNYVEVEKQLRAITETMPHAHVSPFISNEVMVSSQSNLAGVVLKGIDPDTAGQVTDLAKNLEQGSLDNLAHPEKLKDLGAPEPDDDDPEWRALRDKLDDEKKEKGAGKEFVPVDAHGKPLAPPPKKERRVLPGILVGRELAKNLRLFVGDDVNVISPMGDIGPTGPMPKSRAFRVAGIFYSGMYEYDTKYVYLSIPAAQKFLGTDGEITGFEIRIADPDATDVAVEKLRGALGAGYEVQSWQELNRNLFSALKVEKVAMFVVLCFIIGVAGFSIIANGIMLVREKRRDIAILKSMGAGDRTVANTFLLMGLYMGLIGVAAGILTGALTCLLLGRFGISLDTDVYYISKLPVKMNPREVLAVFGAAMSIVIGATVPPALAAAWMRPVDGLRYDQN